MKEHCMTDAAMVLERTANGIIVRPHAQYWQRSDQYVESESKVHVFNSMQEFFAWFEDWWPGPREAPVADRNKIGGIREYTGAMPPEPTWDR